MSQLARTVSNMNPDTAHALRRQALGFLSTVDDPAQAHEVRVVASGAFGWLLFYLHDDEGLLTDILAVLSRAIDRDDRSPMLLLFEAGPTIHRNAKLAAAVVRLGERALSRGNTYALARITIALGRRTETLLHRAECPDPLRAPPHWIRALIAGSPPDQLKGDVRDAVCWWLPDEGNDLDAVRDVIRDRDAVLDERASSE
jgi:hypothetical protein